MDMYLAFLFVILVGQWLLLFAIWRALVRLVYRLAALDEERSSDQPGHTPQDIPLLGEGRWKERDF